MTTQADRFLSGSGFSFFGIVPRALTIAGSDSGGGAGIQADLKTFTAYGVFGTSAITAITAQNTLGVTRVQALDPSLVEAQIQAVLEDIGTDSAKTGMLANAEIIQAVARSLDAFGVTRLVVDPVMIAASGHRLIDPEAVGALKDELFPRALVITPNLPETEALIGKRIGSLAEMQQAAKELHKTGCRYVIVKGGHLPVGSQAGGEAPGSSGWAAHGLEGPVTVREIELPVSPEYPWGPADETDHAAVPGLFAIDVVYDGETFTLLKSPYVKTRNTHGTGCTFSAAIAAGLALGLEPLEAIAEAKRFVTQAIRYSLSIGKGNGPTNHLLRFAPRLARAGSGGSSREAAP